MQPLSLESDSVIETEAVVKPSSKSILIVDSQPWNTAAKELFSKMLAAMKLQDSEVQIVFVSDVSGAELQVKALSSYHIICFADKAAADFSFDPQQFTKTISPAVLVQKPELKRQAWEDLKSALVKMER